MKKIFAIKNNSMAVDIVLLLTRLYVGYAFILHGSGKIQNPLGWMGPDAVIPSVFQALAAISEFGGGIALLLGILTRLGVFGLGCTMAVAAYMHLAVFGDPIVNLSGGNSAEPAIVYFLVCLLFFVLGPGRISLDRKIFGSK